MMGSGTRGAWHSHTALSLPVRSRPFFASPPNPTGIDVSGRRSSRGRSRRCSSVAFKRSDFDRLAKDANDRLELFLFETKKAAQRLDRQYALSQRLSSVAESVSHRARLLDKELEISLRWRAFTLDFTRNWPRYRRQLKEFLDTPLGGSLSILFFVWFALSGWLFRFFIFAVWVLPFAGPLLVGALANNLAIKGSCPACRREFLGYKNQVIRCGGCGNIVWQPKSDFSNGSKKTGTSRSDPRIIDIDFEEK